jgi:RNA polymerase sigma factor (sigma-70 family)
MSERTDQEWVRQLKQADPQAVAALWEMVFLFAANLHGVDEDLARDGALAAFWRIRDRGVHQYGFRCPFRGFCRVIVVREVSRLLTKPQLTQVSLETSEEEQTAEPDLTPKLEAAALAERLRPCLEQISARERAVLQLLYLDEDQKSAQEAADALGVARNNLNQIAHRMRHTLRRCLEKRGYFSADELLHV